MRKIITILTAISLLFCLTGCFGKSSGQNTVIEIKPTHTIYYHLNENETYEAEFSNEYWSMPVGREDDGSFNKDGYVLLGYSLSKDGKGDLIRPGYRFELPDENTEQHLYCVWAKETKVSYFETTSNGATLKITAYKGSDKVVYIPRQIDGKDVTAIADNAFAGNKALEEVHITSSVLEVAPKAFANCQNLKTVTLYDNLKSISDASFIGGTPVKTVRMCAGKTPRYTNNFETYGIKYERIIKTKGEKRIIVLAGSSALYGIDTKYMESLFENDYTVINYGTNANQSIVFYLDAIAPYLTKNDVVIFSPEQYGPFAYYTNGNPEMPSITLQGISTSYNLFENIDVLNYTKVFDAIGQFCTQSARMSQLSWYDHSPRLDTLGDNATLTSEMNSKDFVFGKNGSFRFNETVIPEEYIPNLNRVIDKINNTEARIFFSYPPHNVNNIENSSKNEDAYDFYNKWIEKTVHCPLISDIRNYIYNAEYFDNTDYHLNTVGREMHSKQLAKDIKSANIGIK